MGGQRGAQSSWGFYAETGSAPDHCELLHAALQKGQVVDAVAALAHPAPVNAGRDPVHISPALEGLVMDPKAVAGLA